MRRTHAFARRASGCGFAAALLLAAGATRCESTDPGCNDLICATGFVRAAAADTGGGARAAPAPTVASVSKPGPHKVAKLGESDGLRNGPGYKGATVYFPRDGQPPFGSVVIVPGYVSPERSIKAWGPFYASHGIVAMTIGTNSSRDRPEARSLALLDADQVAPRREQASRVTPAGTTRRHTFCGQRVVDGRRGCAAGGG